MTPSRVLSAPGLWSGVGHAHRPSLEADALLRAVASSQEEASACGFGCCRLVASPVWFWRQDCVLGLVASSRPVQTLRRVNQGVTCYRAFCVLFRTPLFSKLKM